MALLRTLQDSPAGHIVEILQRHGPLSIKAIEEQVGVTKTAVRQQLTSLMASGMVTTQLVREGVGRPHYVYLLTEKAREVFSCYCDELVLSLYEELLAEVGSARISLLLNRVGSRLATKYDEQLRGSRLGERVRSLVSVMEDRGMLTDLRPTNQGFVLKSYNCPYHELAQEHREICEMEQTMMSSVLAADVELTQCMMDGHRGCEFTVLPRSAAIHIDEQGLSLAPARV